MPRSIRILLADDDEMALQFLKSALTDFGHEVVGLCADGNELLEQYNKEHPDLVMTDVMMPGMDGIEAAERLYQSEPVPIVFITGCSDQMMLERAIEAHAFGYLTKPFTRAHLKPFVEMAYSRFQQFQVMREETDNLRQALEDRKVIERAKGLLMKEAYVDEEVAYKRLQKVARASSKKLVEVARMIIVTSEAMHTVGQK